MFKIMTLLMLPAGGVNIALGVTAEDLAVKLLMIIAGILTVVLSCLIASHLRHLENHGKLVQELLTAMDTRCSAHMTKMDSLLKHVERR